MTSDPVELFAGEAERFRAWARNPNLTGYPAAREALLRITSLYLAGLGLPPAWSDELATQSGAGDIEADELRAVSAACAHLPFDYYAEVFDPFVDPPEEPVTGSLSDDIADIYRDVITGLREYEAGRRAVAVWEWSFGLQAHWGEHATSAIRALHCWLAANTANR